MTKRKKRKVSQSKRAKAIRTVKLQKMYAERRKKTQKQLRKKAKLYNSLLDSYIEKQIQLGKFKKGEKGIKKKARESDEMKQIVRDLKSKDPFLQLSALKKTTRRDNIPDTIPVGETPAAYTEAA